MPIYLISQAYNTTVCVPTALLTYIETHYSVLISPVSREARLYLKQDKTSHPLPLSLWTFPISY